MRRKKIISLIIMTLTLIVSAVSLAACKSDYNARHEIPGIKANSAELFIEHDSLTFARGMEVDDAKIIVACGAVLSDAEGHTVTITEKHLRDKLVGYEKFNVSTAGTGRKIKVSYKKAEYYIFYDVIDYTVNFYLDEAHSDLWKSVPASARLTDELDLSVWVNTAEYNYSTDAQARVNDSDGASKFSGWYTTGGEAVTGSYTLSAPTAGSNESVLNVHAEYLTDEEYGALDLTYDARGRRVFGGYKGAATDKVTVPEGVTFIDLPKIFSNSPSVTATGFKKLHIPSTAELGLPLDNILNTVGLEEITVDGGSPRYSAYKGGLYSKSFKSLYLMPAGNMSAELYEELVTVERYSCAYWQVTKLVLPASVQSLNSYCFAFSKLTEVDDYKKVPSVQAGVFYGTEIDAHYDYDSDGNVIAIYTALGNSKYSLSVIVDKTLTEYSLIKGTTGIAGDAFNKCESLVSVNLGDELETIGGSAFAGCTSLTSITLPATVKYIGSSAFRDCTSLERVTGLGDVTYNDVAEMRHHTLPDKIFYGCAKLKAVNSESGAKLDDKIIEIGSQAFYGCASIPSIVLPSGLEVIGSYAFHTCSKIEEFDLPDTLTTIGNYAFYQSGLSSINLEKLTKVTKLGLRCFAYTKLTEVKIPSWITEIPDYCFYYIESLLKVDMGSVTSVGAYAFNRCTKLSEITWSDKLTEIGSNAFRYCNALVNVTIPDSVRYVGGYAFANSTKLETLHLGKDLRTFGEYPMDSELVFGSVQPAIYTNAKLKSITVSEENQIFRSVDGVLYGSEIGGENVGQYSVLYIVPSAIELSESTVFTTDAATKWILPYSVASNATITEIVLSDGVETIGKGAFYASAKLKKLHLSASVSYIGASILLNCTGIEEVTLDSNNQTYSIGSGILYTKDGKTAVMFFGTSTEIVLSETLEKVDDAFFMNTKITSVTLPDSVKTIGYQAFKGCESLTSIYIGSGLESFDPTAFAQLPNLQTISVSDANPNFKAVDNILYSKDGKTLYLCPAKSGMTALTIPSEVTRIADWAFAYHATLSSVVLPKNSAVKEIGSYAFYECRRLEKFFGGEGLETIGERAFSFATSIDPGSTGETRCCDTLKTVLVYAGVKVGDNAFYGHYGIENLYLKMTDVELAAFLSDAGTNIAFLTRGCSTGSGGYYNNDGSGVNRYLYNTSAPLQPIDGYGWFYFADDECLEPTPGV